MKYLLSILFCITLFMACESENVEDLLPPVEVIPVDTTTTDSSGNQLKALFKRDMLPLMELKCATQACHSATGQNLPKLETYTDIKKNKNSIENRAVTIGDMPDGGPSLSQEEKNIITTWIAEGARNN